MVELEKRPSGDWFADLSRLGVDIVEYTVECGPGYCPPGKVLE
ncbi:Phage protein [Klebsiella pneumoniae IS22]|nr:Phage protein [Klebsiella pneumoniae IS22]